MGNVQYDGCPVPAGVPVCSGSLIPMIQVGSNMLKSRHTGTLCITRTMREVSLSA